LRFALQGFGPFPHGLTLGIPLAKPVGNVAIYVGRVRIAGAIRKALTRIASWSTYPYFTL
jgi:hypothetical protein